MSGPKSLIAGNWKMNGSLQMATTLCSELVASMGSMDQIEILVCPAFPLLGAAQSIIGKTNIKLGAQDMDWHDQGAFTGQVSAEMLLEQGCEYVILGHSERRAIYGESDQDTGKKVSAALATGMTPIICVGETQSERDQQQTEKVVERQLDAVFAEIESNQLEQIVVAYEPVWAIGTGLTATPTQAQDVHSFIRGLLAKTDPSSADKVRILYGGSMKPDNAADLLSQQDIDGGLIGGASLKAADFSAICESAAQMN